eukprot:CAMPEP_0172546736 /NCGR_PEP_ID=MMETSP1067-20121228/16441_1 /TAXON_ID=265564 ORGANISM="Thalassiosira punctigera, Strain Tpunct2005C2" /NCGR_SAMPLE_ID=MMETSP1067 /ASSEMBLY_ACC=CAM_ASM_000444 /LENGTH=87 /DNA_ID=CAMNT_0013333705 /DNA_START=138 /DNA_END=397 /DNA_ORIENTATION=-
MAVRSRYDLHCRSVQRLTSILPPTRPDRYPLIQDFPFGFSFFSPANSFPATIICWLAYIIRCDDDLPSSFPGSNAPTLLDSASSASP